MSRKRGGGGGTAAAGRSARRSAAWKARVTVDVSSGSPTFVAKTKSRSCHDRPAASRSSTCRVRWARREATTVSPIRSVHPNRVGTSRSQSTSVWLRSPLAPVPDSRSRVMRPARPGSTRAPQPPVRVTAFALVHAKRPAEYRSGAGRHLGGGGPPNGNPSREHTERQPPPSL